MPNRADSLPPAPAPLEVSVRGLLRGRELEGAARLELAGTLRLAPRSGARPVELGPEELDGVEVAGGTSTLVLFLRGGDALELDGGAPAADAVERWATRLPELTRALRAVGTRRAAGAEHDRFFAPLIEARAHAERGGDWEAQHAAFAPHALRAALERAMGDFAASRHPDSPPDRRALEAELGEYAECVLLALDALAASGARLASAPPRARIAAWRDWVAGVGRVFDEADRCWIDARAALAATPVPEPPPPPGLVRRLLGGARRRRA